MNHNKIIDCFLLYLIRVQQKKKTINFIYVRKILVQIAGTRVLLEQPTTSNIFSRITQRFPNTAILKCPPIRQSSHCLTSANVVFPSV